VPCAWFEVVAGEVDSVPQPAPLQGDKVTRFGTHAVRRPPARVGEGHHLESRGQAGETEVRYLGDVSHFDHLLSARYLGAVIAAA
jgi:hypothetical protein